MLLHLCSEADQSGAEIWAPLWVRPCASEWQLPNGFAAVLTWKQVSQCSFMDLGEYINMQFFFNLAYSQFRNKQLYPHICYNVSSTNIRN